MTRIGVGNTPFFDIDIVLVVATFRVRNYLLAGGFKPERRWFFEFLVLWSLSSTDL
jgi:hypothetical protein